MQPRDDRRVLGSPLERAKRIVKAIPDAIPDRFEIVPFDIEGVLHDIDEAGTGVGYRVRPDGSRCAALVTRDGIVEELGTLGGSASEARGTNDLGLIVGGALTSGDAAHHGFVFLAGTMRDLNELIDPSTGWEVMHALGINGRSEIVALAQRDGVDHVVMLRPRGPQHS